MEEGSYRQSRLCRLLGNPVAVAVVQLLAENKQMSPGDIARAAGRSVPRVSNVLAALRGEYRQKPPAEHPALSEFIDSPSPSRR